MKGQNPVLFISMSDLQFTIFYVKQSCVSLQLLTCDVILQDVRLLLYFLTNTGMYYTNKNLADFKHIEIRITFICLVYST